MTKEDYYALRRDYEKIYGKDSPVASPTKKFGLMGKLSAAALVLALVSVGYFAAITINDGNGDATVGRTAQPHAKASFSTVEIETEKPDRTVREENKAALRAGVCMERWKNGRRDADTAYCLARWHYAKGEYEKALPFAEAASVKNPSERNFNFYIEVLSKIDPEKAKAIKEKYGE